jgi:hypothetical protein
MAGAEAARRVDHRWGMTKGKIGFHNGNVAVQHPQL